MHSRLSRALFACALLLPFAAQADDFIAGLQATYVWQRKPAFDSPYAGAHSLMAAREKGYSFSATEYLGWRVWPSTEVYLNGEEVQGAPLSHSVGLGGLSNAEAQKSAGANLVAYRARAFVRHTWGLGGARVELEADKNQFAATVDSRRVVLTAGNFAVTDVFDRSDYSGDARTQFLNLSFTTHGAFDYAADTRGYTWGAALEGWWGDWQLRAGHFLVPKQPNGPSLDWQAFRHFSEVFEAEHTHRIGEREGNVRLLAFRDRAVMARFDDALAAADGGVPSLDAVRAGVKTKHGVAVAFDQAITQDAGVFARAARSDGREEVYAFAEIDRSLSIGALVHGGTWGRGDDSVGVALARNALSSSHRAYLAAGGLGYFVGDGRLNYRPEQIVELFYSAALGKHLSVSADWQTIRHPAYNADRGPVRVANLRLHTDW
jgi:high affinity Mn2+ porin